jgi:hypothetical protein
VESYDASLGLLKGSFQLFMVHDPSHTKFDPSLPDTLRFTQGKLSLILKK